MPAPIVDCHSHTRFSDGEPTFEGLVRAAAAAGCQLLVSTDHLTLPASMNPEGDAQVIETDLPAHRAAFDAAKILAAQIAPEMEFVYGFECDWYEGCEPLVEKWSDGAVFRLGSVHWLGDPGDIMNPQGASVDLPGTGSGWIDYSEEMHLWEEFGPDEVWRRYVDTWCRACESPLAFSSMAHPDLAMRFANEGFAPTMDLQPLWSRMAECAHDTGRHIEVSTAGLRKTVGDYYPTRGLLECFARAEVPITVGSDAHHARDICWGIREAYGYAFSCGYRSFDAPHADGSWQTFAIE